MTEFGKTRHITSVRLGELGYRIVIYPLSLMRLAMRAVEDGLADLKRTDSMESSLPRMQTRAELYELLRYTPGQQWDFPAGR